MLELLIVIFVVIAIGAAGFLVDKHFKGKGSKVIQSSQKVEAPTQAQMAQNDNRAQDAGYIAAGLSDFEANNEGQFPGALSPGDQPDTLFICSSDCSSANSTSVDLNYYEPKDISIHAYVAGLGVPNDSTLYIVEGASCSSAYSLGKQTNGRGFAVLYAVQNGSSVLQECQSA
jgi:hypothetical protein